MPTFGARADSCDGGIRNPHARQHASFARVVEAVDMASEALQGRKAEQRMGRLGRLCHSRMLFVRAYPRESQEMVFDAHIRAFAFFKGACTRGIYDNMRTAVDAVFIGKDRQNRRFLRMCGHYLVEPTSCTPASGWEKGQVENQVGLVRERFFTPRLRVASYDELNAWLPVVPLMAAVHRPRSAFQ